MLKKSICVLALILPCSGFSQDASLGVALDKFGMISGGWWLNQRCAYLSPEKTNAFRLDLGVVNASLASSVPNPAMIFSLQSSGKKASETEPYAFCAPQAKHIAEFAALTTAQWASEIRKVVFEAATRLPMPSKQ